MYDYLGVDGGDEIHWALIRAAYASVAARAIVPMQDVLGLGSEARINTPAAPAGNWTWRAPGLGVSTRRRRSPAPDGHLVGPVSCPIASVFNERSLLARGAGSLPR